MRTLTVTLPDDMVEARVAAGDYASESELVWEGLEGFLTDDPAVEAWLRGEIAGRDRNRMLEPTPSIPAEEVMDRIQQRYAAKRR